MQVSKTSEREPDAKDIEGKVDGVVRSKTHTTTSFEVSFTFNNNLDPSEKEALMKEEEEERSSPARSR